MNRAKAVALIPLLVVVSCAAQTTATPPTAPDALTACRQAMPKLDVVSGTWTSVADLRGWGVGGPVARHPLSGAFPNARPTDQAAWCWTRDLPDSYTAWGVRPPGESERALGVSGPSMPIPSGPPLVP